MNGKIVAAVAVGAVVLVILVFAVSISNSEVRLRNLITAKQKDNSSEYDNLWKKIAQVAEVTSEQKNALIEIFVQHAKARTGEGSDKAVVRWIQESVPNVDTSAFKNLQNVITASRDGFTMRQKELLDLKREHDNMLGVFPSSIVLSVLGRQPIDVVIVTSTRTDNAFKSGKDDDVELFKKNTGR